MPDSLSLTMLPAKEGDCLLLSYGAPDARRHVLIDAGRNWTYKNALANLLAEQEIKTLELLVVTHVDRDHIDGMLALMRDPALDIKVRSIWFNTWAHLEGESITVVDTEDDDTEAFGAKMGEELSGLIVEKGWAWNSQFGGAAVVVSDTACGNIITLDELKLTLLSPTRAKLDELKPEWVKECRKAGITPGAVLKEYVLNEEDDELESFGAINIDLLAAEPFSGDHSEANGSSIAFLAEYGGRRILLAGDAHEDVLVPQLQALGATPTTPLAIDAFKIPHHGSKYNVSKDLLQLIDCKHYLISTNGNYFKHPDDVAIARLIKFGGDNPTLHFNYDTQYNRHWRNAGLQAAHGYRVEYPEAGRDGFKVVEFGAIKS
ncbi:ComEC/Rec2 family competence protein [Pseudomarimonas arenosa]|uniref:MBL fold metallo-hydrolase n=1 Tax=Pseudomarimonas arenosa TaxID=2774145 RepID=A0AAW3ZQL7_9GAMM|nr:hypothetical protein [Pseudomarimonas arenosa]MBD8527427.1 hypothetical protein [Pseudomarimonas arenosa]